MTLQEWAEYFNDMEYGNDKKITDSIEQLKNDGVVVVIGQSDNLLEFYGALNDEINCYYNNELVLIEDTIVSKEVIDDFIDYVGERYTFLVNPIKKLLTHYTNIVNITYETSDNGLFDITANFPSASFKVRESDDSIYRFFIKQI